jgi:ACS family sodium-dependent inorganic phosphate cotransporter
MNRITSSVAVSFLTWGLLLTQDSYVTGYRVLAPKRSAAFTPFLDKILPARWNTKTCLNLKVGQETVNAPNIETLAAMIEVKNEKVSLPVSIIPSVPPLNKQGYVILTLLFLLTALCALDRVAMSIAILPMGTAFQYSDSTRGLISSVFSLGYMVGLVPSGLLGTFSSPKSILSAGVVLWSLAQIATPFAAYTSLPILLITRFVMGIAEAVAIPTVQTFVARWVPEYQRSIVLGVVLSGLSIGHVIAYLLSPTIFDNFQWEGLFAIYGSAGFVWLSLWIPFSKDNPPLPLASGAMVNSEGVSAIDTNVIGKISIVEQQENQITENQEADGKILQHLTEDNEAVTPAVSSAADLITDMKEKLSSVPWGEIVSSKEIRAIAVAHSVQNFGTYINLAWLPSFFNQRYHLSVTDSSLSAVLPSIAGAIVGSGTGFVADKFLQNGVDKTLIRKVAQTFSLLVPAVTLAFLSVADDLSSQGAIAFFVVAVASSGPCVAGFGSSVQDVCKDPKLASTLYGVTSGIHIRIHIILCASHIRPHITSYLIANCILYHTSCYTSHHIVPKTLYHPLINLAPYLIL